MMSAGRLIVDAVDAVVAESLADAVASEILLRAHSHEEGVNLGVESVGIGKHATVESGYLIKREEERAAECAYVRELVKIGKRGLECFASPP